MGHILIEHRVDDDPVRYQALRDDLFRKRRRDDRVLLATLAGTLLAPGLQHEVSGRLDIELLALVIADDSALLAAVLADALLRRAGDHPLHTWQFRRQRLPSGML